VTDVMQGVRVLEVAEHTFVPAASALLADWGAEVIKVEHVERGDAMRGLARSGLAVMGSNVHVLLEHSNRGKQSLGLDLTTDEGLEILYELVKTADVFLTNKLPSVRQKLSIGIEAIRARNPDVIYVSGTGQGEEGPEADKGSYDSLAYWARAGCGMGGKRPDDERIWGPPAPAFGDSIGAMTIAGGIMGALYHRERTGEATSVDVSLLGVGMWSMGAAIALSLELGFPMPMGGSDDAPGNPLVHTYRTSDGRFLSFSCLQAIKYWPDMCRVIGRPELAEDPRFADHESLMSHNAEAYEILLAELGSRTFAEWKERLADFIGQWAPVQDVLEVAEDPQAVANGYIQDVQTADGTPFKLVAAPVRFGGQAARPGRSPDLNEQGDDILASLGLDWDRIVDLKVKGVVA
jgi:crotonobetainyl-CoA:carnitine CoA-transferase CaiB-like acyl-CoA transferase